MIRVPWMATALAAGLLFASLCVGPTPLNAQNSLDADRGGQARRKSPEMLLNRLDTDGDGQVSRDEWQKPEKLFNRIDSNGDGVLTLQELQALDVLSPKQGSTAVKWIDVHVHPSTGRLPKPDAKGTLEAALSVMDSNQISLMVLMPQPMINEKRNGKVLPPAPVERWIDEARKYPDRFVVMGGGGSLNSMIHDESADGHPSEGLKKRFAERAEAILEMGAVGFGELAILHLSMVPGQQLMDVPADHPLLLMLSDIAAKHDVVIDVHFDLVREDIPRPDYLSDENPAVLKRNLDGFERFLEHNRDAKICWAHVGSDRLSFWTAEFTREMLAKHPNLYMSLRLFPSKSGLNYPLTENGITAEWMETFTQYPDRFFIGGDQFFVPPALSRNDGPGARFARQSQDTRDHVNLFLGYLPPEIAKKFAFENTVRVYKLTDSAQVAR